LTKAIVFGMIGPLLAATTSGIVVERAYRRDPTAVTPTMIRAWAAKVAFFVAYVVLVIEGLATSTTPFVISFTACFLASYAVEAYLLHRLFSRAWRGAR
jgi:hypothetical protein